MSDNEGSEMEVEDQSEDGELTKSPHKHSPMPLSKDMTGYGISEDDADDTADSLDIKPPQAAVLHHHKSSRSSSSSKRDKHGERSSSGRREHIHGSKSDSHRKSHHRSREHRERHEERMREKHHHRERREHSKPMVERGERVLEDLRERLLDKRRSENERRMKMERRERERHVEEEPVQVLPPPKETPREKAERLERELRRERLLEADREMARQKDAYRRELEARRERRHLEKEKERTLRELAKKRERTPSRERKKHRGEELERKDLETGVTLLSGLKDELSQQVVTVSDDSDDDEEEETNSGAENSKGRGDSQSHGQDMEEDEVSSLADEEEDEDEESGSSSATEEDAGDTGESTRQNSDAEEPYSNRGSPVVAAEQQSPIESKVNQNQTETSKTETTENKTNQADENGILVVPEGSPKSDVALEDTLPPYLPAIQGCRSVEEFQCLNRIEEGTYGVVYRARDKRTNEVVALKKLKMEKEKEGFPITSLREINTLLKAQHPNIVTVREIVVGSNMDLIFIVMDYVEHDLKSLMQTMKQKKQCFIPGEVKCLMQQLLRAVAHLHDNWILHRDLKTSNLLLSHKGILKVGDFGLAREYGSPLKGYTPTVVTLWYRAPELLLCTKEYSTPIDMWSVGCIFGEFLTMEALFPGTSEVEQLNRVFKDLGTPNERIWPGYSKLPAVQKMTFADYPVNQLRMRFGTMITEVGMDLMNRFLTYDPVQRVTAEDALRHPYFSEAPLPIDPAMFPTWPAKSELGHRKAAAASPKPPPGGHEYKQLGDDEEVPAGGFHMGVTEKGRIAVGGGFSLKF